MYTFLWSSFEGHEDQIEHDFYLVLYVCPVLKTMPLYLECINPGSLLMHFLVLLC